MRKSARAQVTVVGLGPADLNQLTQETWAILTSGDPVLLRTGRHPAAESMAMNQVAFATCDAFYEKGASFEEVYEAIVDHVLNLALQSGGKRVIYAVPGHPLVAEETVTLLLAEGPKKGVEIHLHSAMSFLDPVLTALKLDPVREGLAILDALALPETLPTQWNLLFTQVYSLLVASDLKLALLESFEPEHPVQVVFHAGDKAREELQYLALEDLDRQGRFDHLTCVFVPKHRAGRPPCRYPLDPLVEVFQRLLGPGGCPWDRAQSHASLKAYLIEEAYEVLEAIDLEDMGGLQEELGDVLLQVVFHGALAHREGLFDWNDIVQGVTEKLIRRHPHVFGSAQANHASEVSVLWDQVKKEEKAGKSEKQTGKIYGALPALLMTEAYLKARKQAGMSKVSKGEAQDRWQQSARALEQLTPEDHNDQREALLAQALFDLAVLAKTYKCSPETLLISKNQEMIQKLPKK